MTRVVRTAARRCGRATAYGGALTGLLAAALAVPAAAAVTPGSGTGGGAAPDAGPPAGPAPDAAPGPTGAVGPALGPVPFGVRLPAPAVIRGFRCLAGCADARTPLTGAALRVRGRGLRGTDVVTFLGAPGDADDVSAKPLRRTRTAVDVPVPLGAVTGPVTLTDRTGLRPSSPPATLTIAPGRAEAPRALVADGPRVEVQVADPRGFFDAAVAPHVTYVVHGTEATDVTIEVVHDADGAVVASWPAGTVAPETPQRASWDGTAGGHLQRAGRYSFRITALPPGVAAAASSAPDGIVPAPGGTVDPASFVFLRHVFPVRGPHYFGEGAARFGGGRGHQGQDVFAACGTPLLAARGGVVQFRGYQAAAGNYLVIDGARTGIDYGYMHLKSAPLVKQGERVRTGQPIGYVGDTGHADGCHLHLELWTAPGWYDGGAPYDPLPSLLAWDRLS